MNTCIHDMNLKPDFLGEPYYSLYNVRYWIAQITDLSTYFFIKQPVYT